MKDMLFGIEMLAFYGIILGFAFWELWKTSKLPGTSKDKESDAQDKPEE